MLPAYSRAMPPATSQYCWPLKPFNRQHPVRGYFNDPRNGEHSNAFHFGIDVAAPDGTAVYAVEEGIVHLEGPQNVSVVRTDGSCAFGYWHIVPVVRHLQTVRKNELLGHIAKKWGHVHFAEHRGGEYVNPCRPGAITPYRDPSSPKIDRIILMRGAKEVDPTRVSGDVDVIVDAFDRPALRVPDPKWTDMPVAPALIRWRVMEGTKAVRPWHTPIDFRLTMLPAAIFDRIYAPGTRQNHPGEPGVYRFYLGRTWTTRLLPNGDYRIEVEASDIDGNKALAKQPITIQNR
jgi:hypothetical protein